VRNTYVTGEKMKYEKVMYHAGAIAGAEAAYHIVSFAFRKAADKFCPEDRKKIEALLNTVKQYIETLKYENEIVLQDLTLHKITLEELEREIASL